METEMAKTAKGLVWKWVLGLSLALNLLVAGVFAGAAWRHSGDIRADKRGAPSIERYGAPFVRALPRDAKRELNRRLRAQTEGLPSRAERRDMYQQMVGFLREDTFDPNKIAPLFAVQKDAAQGIMGVAQTEWLSIVADMSVAERNEVADRLEQSLERRRQKDKKRP